jgi:hypothetical protein
MAQTNVRPYNVCQECGGKFTVDSDTKKRHFIALILALAMLGFTFSVYYWGSSWLLGTIVSHVVFWVYVGYATSKVIYVPYRK